MDPHIALAIAQIVFYVPVVPLAIWLMRRNGRIRPRMAWWPFIPFSLLRLAGGPLAIALHHDPTNIALATVALIFLNVGVVPLLVAASGFLRIVIIDNLKSDKFAVIARKLLRISNILAISLLSAGGGLAGQPNHTLRAVGQGLSFAGYGVFTAELAVIVATATRFSRFQDVLHPSSHKVIVALFVTSPFLLVRTVYAFVQVAHQHELFSKWNPLYGSAPIFAIMALLMEYIALTAFMFTGYSIPAKRVAQAQLTDNGYEETRVSLT